ncbi:MAG: hypothetical protein ACI4O7_09790 [Aristaeellaceae bacterium]
MKICPMCGYSFEGNGSDILPGSRLCTVCADNIRTFARSKDNAERQAAYAYITDCRELTAQPDVQTAINSLFRDYGTPSAAEAAPEAAAAPEVSAAAAPQPDSQFGSAGPQIISVANTLLVLGVIVSLVVGFLLIAAGANSRQGGMLVGIGIGIAFMGSVLSSVFALLVRGFGEMVNNVRIQTELAVRNASRE